MRTTPVLFAALAAATAVAQPAIVVDEARHATRVAWIGGAVRPVELRIDYGAAAWQAPDADELDRGRAATFRLGSGGWATLHAGAELRFGERSLPAGIWYLALHRDADAKWSLAVLEPAKVLRQGVLPAAVGEIKPALLVPLQRRDGRPPQAGLRIAFLGGEAMGRATLSVCWGELEMLAEFAADVEPAGERAAPGFRKLDERRAIATGSGLRYEPLRVGIGPSPRAGSKVRVHYVGWLADGKQIDSSLDRGQEVTFGIDQVIKGWTEALQLMNPGAAFLLEIPPDLGYGERGAGPSVPGNATLYFWVELLAIE